MYTLPYYDKMKPVMIEVKMNDLELILKALFKLMTKKEWVAFYLFSKLGPLSRHSKI